MFDAKCIVCKKRAWLKEEKLNERAGSILRDYVCVKGHRVIVKYRRKEVTT